jgi:hypothetical protein
MISSAFTKKVVKNGMIKVRYSKRAKHAKMNRASVARNRIQYINFDVPVAI